MCAADPDDGDLMLVFEYWSHLEEFAAGQHSEIGAYFLRETGV